MDRSLVRENNLADTRVAPDFLPRGPFPCNACHVAQPKRPKPISRNPTPTRAGCSPRNIAVLMGWAWAWICLIQVAVEDARACGRYGFPEAGSAHPDDCPLAGFRQGTFSMGSPRLLPDRNPCSPSTCPMGLRIPSKGIEDHFSRCQAVPAAVDNVSRSPIACTAGTAPAVAIVSGNHRWVRSSSSATSTLWTPELMQIQQGPQMPNPSPKIEGKTPATAPLGGGAGAGVPFRVRWPLGVGASERTINTTRAECRLENILSIRTCRNVRSHLHGPLRLGAVTIAAFPGTMIASNNRLARRQVHPTPIGSSPTARPGAKNSKYGSGRKPGIYVASLREIPCPQWRPLRVPQTPQPDLLIPRRCMSHRT